LGCSGWSTHPDQKSTEVTNLAAAQGISLAANHITGFMFEVAEHQLDGTHLRTRLGSYRLFRRQANVRYHGRLHEQPEAPSTVSHGVAWAVLPGGAHIKHIGYDEGLFERR
jgi:hypothetical protein